MFKVKKQHHDLTMVARCHSKVGMLTKSYIQGKEYSVAEPETKFRLLDTRLTHMHIQS
jgi:hypothetical protein